MLSIQEQIHALQRKQATIDFYERIRTLITNEPDPVGYQGISQEIAERLGKSIDAEVKALLGETNPPEPVKAPTQPTEEDLKRFMAAMSSWFPAAVRNPSGPAAPLEAPKKSAPPAPDPNDPLRFLLTHKHLDGRTVSVRTPDGVVRGVVRGLDAPHIVVQTETGYTVGVLPENCEIVKG